jgi:hypothetical protein
MLEDVMVPCAGWLAQLIKVTAETNKQVKSDRLLGRNTGRA